MQGGSFIERAVSAAKGLTRRGLSFDKKSTMAPVSSQNKETPAERVRLVIWDLDETFWKGTLTEGGIEYLQENHDAVIELARRGIMSSICSRNDHDTIEALLRERGIWDYFVFPEIDWTSKGPRLKRIAEASQLRAPTILFIDDNPMNRAEARRFVEGMQVADPADIESLIDDPLLQGKEDNALTRLAQYKLLERRSKDMKLADDNTAFLRESGIKVFIEHDIEPNLDRAIELINRTNQLNFTKSRLPEDQEAARGELRFLLSGMEKQAGLVRVVDHYGDYGYCGLYVQDRSLHGLKPKLVHYCFSCRTLGMEVETWLYRRLGRPDLEVRGEVLTDIVNSESVIDWISMETADPSGQQAGVSGRKIPRVYIRGGCESVAIAHYFEALTDNLTTEFAFQREDVPVRLDHSQMLRLALDKPSEAEMDSLLTLGYKLSDFETDFLQHSGEKSVYILGFWAESNYTVFRHKTLNTRTLIYLSRKIGVMPEGDLLTLNLDELPDDLKGSWVSNAIKELQNNFEFEGLLSLETTRLNVLKAISLLPRNSLVFLIGCTEKIGNHTGVLDDYHDHISLNHTLEHCATEHDNVVFVGIDNYVRRAGDRLGSHNHYSREVYFRLFSDVKTRIDHWMSEDVTT